MLNKKRGAIHTTKQITQSKCKAAYQKGVGLIEVMIAVLVLGVGLLGILTLQKNALQLNQVSYYYSQASVMISDITEKIRSNIAAQNEYELNLGDMPTSSVDCIATPCNSEQLAQWQLAQWRVRVEQIFPQADAEIKIADDISESSVVTLRFKHDKISNNEQSIQVEFRL